MGPLACLMRSRGHAVQGSDRAFDQGKKEEVAGPLRRLGIELGPHDGSAVTAAIDRFVYSAAVEADTPEVPAARAMGIDCVPRPRLLAQNCTRLFVNEECPEAVALGRRFKATTYGTPSSADARLRVTSVGPHRATGVLRYLGRDLTLDVPQPGLHNLENATAAALVAFALGVATSTVELLMARFPGVARRFEVVGTTASGIRVVDDYAHNGE